MIFTYDKHADREVLRFSALGVGFGLFAGAVFGALVGWIHQPLLIGSILALITILALLPNANLAKTLYWILAILLQITGLVVFGVVGALIGLGLWFLVLRIVPALRYVLQLENVISICSATVVVWIISVLIWGVSFILPGQLAQATLVVYIGLGTLIGGIFWGLAKIISSSFKQYHFRKSPKPA